MKYILTNEKIVKPLDVVALKLHITRAITKYGVNVDLNFIDVSKVINMNCKFMNIEFILITLDTNEHHTKLSKLLADANSKGFKISIIKSAKILNSSNESIIFSLQYYDFIEEDLTIITDILKERN